MSERRILMIGSQCRALGRLAFLPQAAQELYAVMIDPGDCVSAIEGGGLLIDPTVEETKGAIKSAYLRAAKDEATLFIAYIGHGEKSGDDYYLLPNDAENPPILDTAVHLTNLIKEAHKKAPGKVDGFGSEPSQRRAIHAICEASRVASLGLQPAPRLRMSAFYECVEVAKWPLPSAHGTGQNKRLPKRPTLPVKPAKWKQPKPAIWPLIE